MPATHNDAAWTPATISADLTRAARTDLGPQRIYFYDLETRAEITDHPLAGMHWTGSGPMVSLEGRYVDGTAKTVHGAAWLDGTARLVTVDATSFPGRKVVAKVWYGPGSGEPACWRILARGDGSAVVGKQSRMSGREWAARYKRGQVA